MRPSVQLGISLALVGMAGTAQAAPLDPTTFSSLATSLAPTVDVTVDTDALTITGDVSLCGVGTCTGVLSGGIAVFTFDDVNLISAVTVTVTGARPLALLATNGIFTEAFIVMDASGSTSGPGGYDGGATGVDGLGPTGGVQSVANGGGGGAFGGDGGTSGGSTAGGIGAGDLVTLLEGGSGGGGGGVAGGGGGGSLELGAVANVELASGSLIVVRGAVGADGGAASGGGGGAGGGVLIHGATGSVGGIIQAGGRAGGASTGMAGGGGGGGGLVHLIGMNDTGLLANLSAGSGGAGVVGVATAGTAGSLTYDEDADGVPFGIDCDDTDPGFTVLQDWHPDCDGDGVFDSLFFSLCDPDGPTGDICFAGVQPANWSLIAGTDCNDEDATATFTSDWYPDCDGDLEFHSTALNACGTLGADAAFDCVDTFNPDGGWSAFAGADCNDEDALATANADYYPDCDGDLAFDSTPVNACGIAGAQTAFDCFDLADPDGGFSTTAGADCNDEDGTASVLDDLYPDCDGDGVFASTATPNVCGTAGANAVFDCTDGLDPDGGWSSTAGADCNDELAGASTAADFFPDCDGDGEASVVPVSACGLAAAQAAFDCVDGNDPDGGFLPAAGTDCDDEDLSGQAVENWFADCDGDAVFDNAPISACGQNGASAAFDCTDGNDPDGGFGTTAGTDCNDEDLAAAANSNWFPDCDGDTEPVNTPVNACGLLGAALAFDCTDGNDPDGGFAVAAGTDCNDEDAAATVVSSWYPDCDNDVVASPSAVNACGLLGAAQVFDCVDGNNPDGGFAATVGSDCNDEDGAASAVSNWYPDCDNDAAPSPAAVNACGLLGAALAFDCNDGNNPDGGFSATVGADCNDEDSTGSAVEPWFPDCDGDIVFDAASINACGISGANAAFDCNDGNNPDGSFSTSAGTDCNDELPAAQAFANWYPDCDDDTFGDPITTNACGIQGANQAFDCDDGNNPDGGWSQTVGTDCDDEEGTTCPDDAQCPDICGDGVDNDCDNSGDYATSGPLGFLDDDGDGILFDDEVLLGTDDCNGDSDNDGLDDDLEILLNTDPTVADTDGDNLSDGLEVNTLGTNPLLRDTDGDQLDDDIEVGDPLNPTSTDTDGIIDALDPDDDGDGVLTLDEDWDGSGDPRDDHSDTDTIPDYLDNDDDGDTILTANEVYNGNTDPLNEDFDLDLLPDYRDDDDDDDTILTEQERSDGLAGPGINQDGGEPNWRDLDSDGDSWSDEHEFTEGPSENNDADPVPDYLDTDSDNDNVDDIDELGNEGLPLAGRNSDNDALEDRIDNDDDNDGLATNLEVYNGNTDPLAENFDLDLLPDFRDNDDDDDGIATSRERVEGPSTDVDTDLEPNWRDLDSDGDGWSDTHEDTEGPSNNADLDFDPDYVDTDSDADGILDINELGPETAPLAARDTDGDTLENRIDSDDDGDDVPTLVDGTLDTDLDLIPNYLDEDDDGDGLLTSTEIYDGETDPTLQNSDGDSAPDYLDDDDDNDNVLTSDEGAPGQNSDSDGLPDFRDNDDDGDNVPTADEAYGANTDPMLEDTDGDLIADYLDDDDDEDGVLTADEAYDLNTDPQLENTDGDALADYLDDDDDGDNVPTADEGAPNQNTDPTVDGIPDYLDDDDDGDTVLTLDEDWDASGDPRNDHSDTDGVPDYLDNDDDDDSLLTANEAYGATTNPLDQDTDGDNLPDFRDDDDDNDTVLTIDEDLDGNGDVRNDDTDGVAPPDYRDNDDDNDGVPTEFEEAEGANRLSLDSDVDGIPDGDEWLYNFPSDADCSDDGCNPGFTRCDDLGGGQTGSDFTDPWDRDGDGIINALDVDDDNDTVPTLLEAGNECLGFPPDGILAHLDFDTDGDGICDVDEPKEDTDGDGTQEILDCTQDGCDADADADGIPNCAEIFYLCPEDASGNCIFGNPQLDPDVDKDGIPDGLEITDPDCFLPEPTSACIPDDTDNDGIIDLYDTDDDGDGFPTNVELGCLVDNPSGDPDPDDGWASTAYVDPLSLNPETLCGGDPFAPQNTDAEVGAPWPLFPDDTPDYLDEDDDGDGKPTDIDGLEGGDPEGLGDVDGDGLVDYLDPYDYDGALADADGDGINNGDEASLGLNPYSADSDGDGIGDGQEIGDVQDPTDSDFDGLIDALDDDDDDDGVPTALEGTSDADNDGVPNHLDRDSNGDGVDDSLAGASNDGDCDSIVDNLDTNPDDGPCGPVQPPFVPETYSRQPCSCAASPGWGVVGWMGLLTLAIARRRR